MAYLKAVLVVIFTETLCFYFIINLSCLGHFANPKRRYVTSWEGVTTINYLSGAKPAESRFKANNLPESWAEEFFYLANICIFFP